MSNKKTYFNNLLLTELKIWSCLKEGENKKNPYFNNPTFGTIRDNNINIRTLVLRKVLKSKKLIFLFTDIRSKKITDIIKKPTCILHVYDPNQKIQIQIQGNAYILKDKRTYHKEWLKMNTLSKLNYLNKKKPGLKIKKSDDYNYFFLKNKDLPSENFAIIKIKIDTIEWLYLRREGNRRAFFNYTNKPSKHWLNP